MEIQKPITVVHAEFIESLTNLINNSGLPPILLEPIFKDMYNDIRKMSKLQYEKDLEQYNIALTKSEDECGD